MCGRGAGVPEPGGARDRGTRGGWEGRGTGVGEERGWKVGEDGAPVEKGEGLRIRLKGRGFFEGFVCDTMMMMMIHHGCW